MEKCPKLHDFGDESFPAVRPLNSVQHQVCVDELDNTKNRTAAAEGTTALIAELQGIIGCPDGTKLLCSLKGGRFLCIHNAVADWDREEPVLCMLFPRARISIRSFIVEKKGKNKNKVIYVACPAAVAFVGLAKQDQPPTSFNEEDRLAFLISQGNAKCSQGLFVLAGLYFTAAVEAAEAAEVVSSSVILLAVSTHAKCMLRLRRYEDVITSCDKALSIDLEHASSLFRKGLALSGLQNHVEALVCLNSAMKSSPKKDFVFKAQLVEAISRMSKLVHQWESGAYDDVRDYFMHGFEVAPDCSDFVSEAVEIRMTPDGKGRGVFLSKDVGVGDLLMVGNPVVVAERKFKVEIIRECNRSSRVRKLLHLLGSDNSVPSVRDFTHASSIENEFEDIIDVRRMKKVAVRARVTCRATGKKQLFSLPALVNHSCVPNSTLVWIGGALFIRAAKRLQAGEEVTVCYINCLQPLRDRVQWLQSWEFVCSCERCKAEKQHKQVLRGISDHHVHKPSRDDAVRASIETAGQMDKVLGKLTGSSDEEVGMIQLGYVMSYMIIAASMELDECRDARRRFKFPSDKEVVKLLHKFAPGYGNRLMITAETVLRRMNGSFERDEEFEDVIGEAISAVTGNHDSIDHLTLFKHLQEHEKSVKLFGGLCGAR